MRVILDLVILHIPQPFQNPTPNTHTLTCALTGEQDPVHGQKVLSGGALLDIMDSQPFQRLRELCQLGTTKCVRMVLEVPLSPSGSLPDRPMTCAV